MLQSFVGALAALQEATPTDTALTRLGIGPNCRPGTRAKALKHAVVVNDLSVATTWCVVERRVGH